MWCLCGACSSAHELCSDLGGLVLCQHSPDYYCILVLPCAIYISNYNMFMAEYSKALPFEVAAKCRYSSGPEYYQMHPNNSVKGVGWVVFDTQAHHAYIFGVATIAHVIKVSISIVLQIWTQIIL